MNFKILDIFKREEKAPEKKRRVRSFHGATNSRFVNWLYNTSYSKINLDLDNGLITLITRARELAKNSAVVRSYLELMEKNVIGKAGFTLQSQVKNSDGKLDTRLNDFLEWEFYDWMKASNGYLTVDGQLGGKELDKLILRSLIVDGEVFIRIHKNAKNPYGLSFEMIDPMAIDFTKRREFAGTQNAIVLGVEIDRNYKPVAYWLKPRNHSDLSSWTRREDPCFRDDPHLP